MSSFNTAEPASSPAAAAPRTTRRSPLTCLLDVFSSIWLGVILLAILFVYSSVGSAVIYVREVWFEMTEFEWFHWWPFNLLCFLICLNIVVATLRRIPFNTLRLGVWMIHTGIIILAVGSVYYFATKIEGDAPIIRRQLLMVVPGHPPMSIPVIPGNRATLGEYAFEVRNIDPEWELLTGDDAGKRVYSVNVQVRTPTQTFMRQLIAGYPEYTEDLVFTGDPQRPMARAVQELDRRIVDDRVHLALDPDFRHEKMVGHGEMVYQNEMYLMNSAAVYLREEGSHEWIMRPIRTGPLRFNELLRLAASRITDAIEPPIRPMPRYKDYIASLEDVWMTEPERYRPRELNIIIPAADPERDPLGDLPLLLTGYTRYADFETRRIRGRPDRDDHDPVLQLSLYRPDGSQSRQYHLVAFDRRRNRDEQGMVALRWIDDEEQLEHLRHVINPRLRIQIPEADIEIEVEVTETGLRNPELEFTPIEGTDYAYRVEDFEDDLVIDGHHVSYADISIRKGEPPDDRVFRRWVFDDPMLNRDLPADTDAAPAGLHNHDHGSTPEIAPARDPDSESAPGSGEDTAHDSDDGSHANDENSNNGDDDRDSDPHGSMFPAAQPHSTGRFIDENIDITYTPGHIPAPVTLVAGPDPERLRLMIMLTDLQDIRDITPGEEVRLTENIMLRIDAYFSHSRTLTRPRVLARHERDRDFQHQLSMIQVEAPTSLLDAPQPDPQNSSRTRNRHWLAYNHYPFLDDNHNLRRFPYRPTTITVTDADGRERRIELLFSREAMPLPHTVTLDTFELVPHIGGFTGRDLSIRDWRSVIRFIDAGDNVTDRYKVSTNAPVSYEGLWYFQAQWDPPMRPRFEGDPPSAGLNYTVLGVGNRNGVYIQLFGSAVAVLGMIYTFYVKPIIKRRRQIEVQRRLLSGEPIVIGVIDRKKEVSQ